MSLLYQLLGPVRPITKDLISGEWYKFISNLYGSVASSVNVVSQSGIPFIIPSSGTMGNNGAVTLTTALAAVYPDCYLYLPANAIRSGSASGWYYSSMSSTTAGTVYNNTYSDGTPTVPKTKTSVSSTGPGAYTQTTGSVQMQTASIPGTLMGGNGRARIESSWSFPNNANNKTPSISFGGSTVFSVAQTTSAFLMLKRDVVNRGTQGRQVTAPATFLGGSGTSTTAPAYLAIDTSKAVTVAFTGQLAAATDYLIHEAYTLEVLPG